MNKRIIHNFLPFISKRGSFLVHNEFEVQTCELSVLICGATVYHFWAAGLLVVLNAFSCGNIWMIHEFHGFKITGVLNYHFRHIDGCISCHLLKSKLSDLGEFISQMSGSILRWIISQNSSKYIRSELISILTSELLLCSHIHETNLIELELIKSWDHIIIWLKLEPFVSVLDILVQPCSAYFDFIAIILIVDHEFLPIVDSFLFLVFGFISFVLPIGDIHHKYFSFLRGEWVTEFVVKWVNDLHVLIHAPVWESRLKIFDDIEVKLLFWFLLHDFNIFNDSFTEFGKSTLLFSKC